MSQSTAHHRTPTQISFARALVSIQLIAATIVAVIYSTWWASTYRSRSRRRARRQSE